MLNLKAWMTKVTQWFASGSTADIYSDADAPSTSSYGAKIRIRGDGKSGTSGGSDTYWLGLDSNGFLYTGTQLNGASSITWTDYYPNSSQTQTFTALGKVWYFTRVGRIVYIDAPTDATSAVAGNNTIGTLPAGMRPGAPLYLHSGNNTADFRLIINTNGTVQLYAPYAMSSSFNCGFSGHSYIAVS